MNKNFTIPFGIAILMVLLIFSCNRQNSGFSANAAAGSGTELRYGLTTEPQTLDPLNPSNTADGRSILFNVYEGLVKIDASGRLVPAVSQSYRIEQDGLIYVFKLRQELLFHNGEALKASDVVHSLNTATASRFPGFDKIAEIAIINHDENMHDEIMITLNEPDPEFLPYLTIGIVPENNPDREKNPIGTGPFMIESYTPQETLRLRKNPHYREDGIPKLDRVTIVFAANYDALITGLMGGNIEGANVTAAQLAQLDPRNFDISPLNSNMVQLLALNNAEKPLDDPRVRQAINYAIDTEEIIETAFFGIGEASGSPLIPALKDAYEESLRNPYPRDIARARALLAEAGFPSGFSIEIIVPSNYTPHVDTAQVAVRQLADAGINATIRLVDWGTWLSEVYTGRKYQATIISLDASNTSPRSFLSRYQSGDRGNFINFKNSEYDRAYNTALTELDEEKRISLYRECQRIISDNAASVYIQDITGIRAFTAGRFGGFVNFPLYVIDFAYIHRNPQNWGE